jgi:hypothetical protein
MRMRMHVGKTLPRYTEVTSLMAESGIKNAAAILCGLVG